MIEKEINWRVYQRDHVYPQSVAGYLDMFEISTGSRFKYLATNYEIMAFSGDYFRWARDVDYLEKVFCRWFSNWLKNKKSQKEIVNLNQRSYKNVQKTIKELSIINVDDLTPSQLYSFYLIAKKTFFSNIIFSEYTVDTFDDYFGKIFIEKLNSLKYKISSSDLSELLKPAYISSASQYRKKILELSFIPSNNDSLINQAVSKFIWVTMSWDGSNQLSASKLSIDINKLKKISLAKRRQELANIKNYVKMVKNKRKQLIKKYNLPVGQLVQYFYLLDSFTKFHDWRKEIQMSCNRLIFLALDQMAKIFLLPRENILYYFNDEIERLCMNSVALSKVQIVKRKAGTLVVIKDKKIKKFFGKKAGLLFNKIVSPNKANVKRLEVKGAIANKGVVKGKVFVASSARQAVKMMKEGQILVTSMTTVDYLPAIRKAAAIVTDDGGMTCHAAIIARELGIPCVVGTKVATKILKNGMMVEVRANHGLVKIL